MTAFLSRRRAPSKLAVMTSSATAPASTAGPYVVRLSGPQGIVAAVPHYLGFVPDESLVLICLTAPRGRIGPVARIDLPPPGCGDVLIPMLECARQHADSVAVVCYHDGPRPSCIDELTRALRLRRIPITATLSVSGGRIRDARSRSAMRRDPGIPLLDPEDDHAVALRSAATLTERIPLPSRAALAASITPAEHWDDTDMRRAIEADLRSLAPACEAAGRALTPELAQQVDAALGAAETEYRDTGRVSMPAAAGVIAVVQHVGCRDLMIARAVRRADAALVGLASAVAAQCPDDYCAQVCATLAATAYRSGDGALAHCALDRAIAAEPGHRMSQLLRAAIAACLPPDSLDILADIPVPAASEAHGVSPDTAEADRSPS